MEELVQIRTHGDPAAPALIYLPGLHGDWTLIGRFRHAINDRARFVEITYPRTLTWSLDDYAAGVEKALAAEGIGQGWLLAESFGSQVAWRLLESKQFSARGMILAGGFVRHPTLWAVRLAGKCLGAISFRLLTRILFGYARVARWRHRHSPETVRALQEFMERRTPLDHQAATHRLGLLSRSDSSASARNAAVPVYGLTGLFDPIVPWWWVRSWLRSNCPALREYHVIRRSDHNVLSNAAVEAAALVAGWMKGAC